MEKGLYKKLKTSGHFRDFFHRASSLRNDKKIRSRLERRRLNKNSE